MVPAPGSCANAFSLGTAVLATDRRAGWPSPECLQVKRSVRAEAFWDHQSPSPSCAEERLRAGEGPPATQDQCLGRCLSGCGKKSLLSATVRDRTLGFKAWGAALGPRDSNSHSPWRSWTRARGRWNQALPQTSSPSGPVSVTVSPYIHMMKGTS